MPNPQGVWGGKIQSATQVCPEPAQQGKQQERNEPPA